MIFMRMIAILMTVAALSSPVLAADGPATITVTGQGHVDVAPDMATFSLGVMTEGETAQAALSSGLSLGPRYDYRNSGEAPKVTGYVASNMVTVKVRALDTLGGLLDKAVADGANALNGVNFGLQDDAAAVDEARMRAVADARHRAELYAKAAGVTLGKILKISEADGYARPMPMAMEAGAFAKSADVPVAAGELGISTTLTLIYEIAD
jgi:uncharacterized protein